MRINIFSMRTGIASVAAFLMLAACNPPHDTAGTSGRVTSSGTAAVGGAFTLVNQDGQTVTEKSLIGKPTLTYFGFSFCPDICPTELQKLGWVQAKIDPDGTLFNYVFFSVDPERDTPESLKQYVTASVFPKNLQGFTGTREQVEAAKAVYRIYAAKVEDKDSAAGYTVDHVSLIYLFDKAGSFVEPFTYKDSVAKIAITAKPYAQ